MTEKGKLIIKLYLNSFLTSIYWWLYIQNRMILLIKIESNHDESKFLDVKILGHFVCLFCVGSNWFAVLPKKKNKTQTQNQTNPPKTNLQISYLLLFTKNYITFGEQLPPLFSTYAVWSMLKKYSRRVEYKRAPTVAHI